MQRLSPFIKYSLLTLLLSGLSGVVTLSAIYLYLNPKLPSVEMLLDAKLQIPLRIYSQNGELIGEFGEKFRTPVQMDVVPQHFINAILAAEDDRFLKHKGVDISGLMRAFLELLKSGEIKTGGSTITMQVARNFFLSKEKSFVRKFNEILLSLKIEQLLSKDQILELYVNKIYLGKRAYGIQAAAAVYYGKSITELDLAQLAMIAGLPKAPSSYNPINNPKRALIRRNWILGRMLKLGFIDKEAWQQAIEKKVTANYYGPKLELDAQYAAEMARAFALSQFGSSAYTAGLKIVTTVDTSLQRSAKGAVIKGLTDYTARHGYRGPELNLSNYNEQERFTQLKKLQPSNGLIPALITGFIVGETEANQVSSNSAAFGTEQPIENSLTGSSIIGIQLLLADGTFSTLFWNQELDQLRTFISENRRSQSIRDIREVLSVNDIIRVQYDKNGSLKLAQLPQASASLIALEPKTGAIKALVGGFDFKQSHFNRVTQATRQPGSNFKPFIYAAALANGYTAASVINDAPIVFSDEKLETDWRPENSSGKFYGPTTLRRALYLSRNLVSVRLLREMGISKAIDYLEQFDLSSGPLPRDLSLALGSYAMTPLDVASLYAVIANGGYRVTPYIVKTVYSRDNRELYQANPELACDDCVIEASNLIKVEDAPFLDEAETLLDIISASLPEQAINTDDANTNQPTPQSKPNYAPRVMDERIAYILDNILKDVIKRGTATKARSLGRSDIAGKTGTTNGPTDAWFSGYHSQLVATSWLGFDNNQLLGRREYGGSAALPIWMSFMQDALQDLPISKRQQPQKLRAVKIDRLTGKWPTQKTEEVLFELFREEFAPKFTRREIIDSGGRESNPILSEDLF